MPPASTVTAAALVAALAVLLAARSWRCALRVLLDLLVAAGLLRLTGEQGWRELAEAAAIVALRTALWRVLAAGPPGRRFLRTALRARPSRPTVIGRRRITGAGRGTG